MSKPSIAQHQPTRQKFCRRVYDGRGGRRLAGIRPGDLVVSEGKQLLQLRHDGHLWAFNGKQEGS